MSSVLVLGATGAIGFEVSLAFLNSGYTVYGLARDQEKANFLLKNEIVPVIGSAADVDIWGPVAERVNVVVEAVLDFTNFSTGDVILGKLKQVVKKNTELSIIYTSGALVYEETLDLVDENSPHPTNPPQPIAVKLAFEREYRSIGAIIIQPAFVFGKSGSASSYLFKAALGAENGVITVNGKKDQYRSFIHSYDLAQLYLLAAQKAPLVRGQVLIGSSQYYKVEEILFAIAQAGGVEAKTINFAEPDGSFLGFVYSLSNRSSSKKAQLLLGWGPVRASLIDKTKDYVQTWKLFNSK